MQIRRDSKYSNANSNHSNQIPSFECKFELFERESKNLNANANHWNQTQSIRMQIPIRKGFECKFEPSKANSKHSNATSKVIGNIRMQILTQFEAFECKF